MPKLRSIVGDGTMPAETESAAREANIAEAKDVESTATFPLRKLATMSAAIADAGE